MVNVPHAAFGVVGEQFGKLLEEYRVCASDDDKEKMVPLYQVGRQQRQQEFLLLPHTPVANNEGFLECVMGVATSSAMMDASRAGLTAHVNPIKCHENWVCLKIVYPYTQWFCWSLSLLNGYFIGGMPHFQTYPIHQPSNFTPPKNVDPAELKRNHVLLELSKVEALPWTATWLIMGHDQNI